MSMVSELQKATVQGKEKVKARKLANQKEFLASDLFSEILSEFHGHAFEEAENGNSMAIIDLLAYFEKYKNVEEVEELVRSAMIDNGYNHASTLRDSARWQMGFSWQ